jgi:MoxR-like ATPase
MTDPGIAARNGGGTPSWWHYRGDGIAARDGARLRLPGPPPWRTFHGDPSQPVPPEDDAESDRRLGQPDSRRLRTPDPDECDMVNLALRLRIPLLVTGGPGSGKSSIAYRLARELQLGRVLHWQITNRTTLRSGLYEYDVIGRIDAAGRRASDHSETPAPSVGNFVRLGPLGTALLGYSRPRVLLIDDLDNSDFDLPVELLHVLENGEFTVAELARATRYEPEVRVCTDDPDGVATVRGGRVRCHAFPIVVITSNGERDYPPAFLRHCLRLHLPTPDADELSALVRAHFPPPGDSQLQLIDDFVQHAAERQLAPDQLLNAVFLSTSDVYRDDPEARQRLITAVWHPLMER